MSHPATKAGSSARRLLVATPDPVGLLEDWPELAQRLAVADHQREDFLAPEDWLLAMHEVPAEAEPALAAAALRLAGSGHGWLRVEALSLVVSRDRLLALPQQAEDAADAAALIDALLPQLPAAGVPHAAGTQRLLDLDTAPGARFAPAWRTAGRPLDDHLPQGPRGGVWRRWLTEAQMLLHEHPLNAGREARGLRPLNALWLAGGAAAAPIPRDCGVRLWGAHPLGEMLPVHAAAGAGAQLWLHRPGERPPAGLVRGLAGAAFELRVLEPSGQQCFLRRPAHTLRLWRRPLRSLRPLLPA